MAKITAPKLDTGKQTHLPNCGCYACNPSKIWWERVKQTAADALHALDEHKHDRATAAVVELARILAELQR